MTHTIASASADSKSKKMQMTFFNIPVAQRQFPAKKTYRQTLGGGGKLKAGTEATTRSILIPFSRCYS
jgi:hypothetical protein